MEDMTLSGQIFLGIFISAVVVLLFYYIYYRSKEKKADYRSSYLAALKYMAEGNKRLAIEKFKETVRVNSGNIDAYIKLGDLLRSVGLFQNAIRIHRDLTLRGDLSSEEMHKVWYSLGLDYFEIKKYEQTEIYFGKIFNIAEFRNNVLPKYLWVLEKNKKYDEAITLIKNSVLFKNEEMKKKASLFKVTEGLRLLEKSEYKEARVIFKDALKLYSGCSAAYAFIGDAYMKEGRNDDAIKNWTEFCRSNPGKAYILFPRLEAAWYEKGQFSKIVELYNFILKKDHDNLDALLALSSIYRKKGDYDRALKLLTDNENIDITQTVIQTEIAHIKFDKGQYKDAAQKALGLLNENYREYVCKECGHSSDEVFWFCPECGALNIII
jgi:lipopolysaccharide biosynthesis regulator YciM